MNDINSVIDWIFNVVNTVTDFIAANLILSLLLFVPIVGSFMLLVYELFLNGSLSSFNIGGSSDNFSIKSNGYGSVYSNLKLSSFTRQAVLNRRRQKAINEREALRQEREDKREKERQERQAKREAEQQMFKKHETLYFDEDGNLVKSESWHRNTLDANMASFSQLTNTISKYQSMKNSRNKNKPGSISREPTYDIDSIKERIMNNTEI